MKGQGKIKYWFTKNGVHIPVYEKYTTRKGVEPENPRAKFKPGTKKESFNTEESIRKTPEKTPFDKTHNEALAKLVMKGNIIIQSDSTKSPDVNGHTDSHYVTALVKAKSGKYTIRGADFSALEGEYKQRNNFAIIKQLRGQSESMATIEYQDFLKRLGGMLKR